MATEKQIAANQLNALKSTGPRTEEGKTASSQNALTHGLTARKTIVLDDENEADFLAMRAALRAFFDGRSPGANLRRYAGRPPVAAPAHPEIRSHAVAGLDAPALAGR